MRGGLNLDIKNRSYPKLQNFRELLASGMTEEAILKECPGLPRDDIRAALEYASKVLLEEGVIPIEA